MARDLKLLDPIVRVKAELLQARCADELGIPIIFTYTLRTKEEQAALYAQGREELDIVNAMRTRAGMVAITSHENRYKVTNTMNSFHLFGCAFDIAVLDNKGKPTWEEAFDGNADLIADYEQVGGIGETCGLKWGGKFTRRDMPHFEYTAGLSLIQLKAGMRPSDVMDKAMPPLSNDTITEMI